MNPPGVSLAEASGGAPGSAPFNRQPGGPAPVGLLAAGGDVSPPTLPTALTARIAQPAISGADVPQDRPGPDADVAPVPAAPADPSLLDGPGPAGQPTTRAALPGASAAWRAEPSAAGADDFFQAVGRGAGGLIRRDPDAGQTDRPAPRDLAAAGPLLLALLGTTRTAREEAPQSRKPRRPRRG